MQVFINDGSEDLAGQVRVEATYLSTRARINRLVERFLSVDVLSDRLSDLPFLTLTNAHGNRLTGNG
jgi:hypothetical protein